MTCLETLLHIPRECSFVLRVDLNKYLTICHLQLNEEYVATQNGYVFDRHQ